MVMGCGNTCVKYILFATNALICLSGLALLGVSLWANLDSSVMEKLQQALADAQIHNVDLKNYTMALWVAVGIGGFVFVIGFLGCCGAACESRCLLFLYTIVLGLLFVAELAVAVFLLVNKSAFNDEVRKAFDQIQASGKLDVLRPVEKALECCGVDGAAAGHLCDYVEDPARRKVGCLAAAEDFFSRWSLISAIVGVFVLVVELVSIVFGCVLIGAIRERYY